MIDARVFGLFFAIASMLGCEVTISWPTILLSMLIGGRNVGSEIARVAAPLPDADEKVTTFKHAQFTPVAVESAVRVHCGSNAPLHADCACPH